MADDDRKTTTIAAGNVAATDVFTSPQLLKTIGAYTPDVFFYINAIKAQRYSSWNERNYAMQAIARGHFLTLKALHRLSKQPPYSTQPEFNFSLALHHAAIHNQLEMLQWLYDQGHREFLASTLPMCVMRGHTSVVTWLSRHVPRCAFAEFGQLAVLEAVERGDLEMLRAIHACIEAQWFFSAAMTRAIKANQPTVIEWLERNRPTDYLSN